MFEMLTYWSWVTVFTYITLGLPVAVSLWIASSWAKHILDKTEMPRHEQRQIMSRANKIFWKPYNWLRIMDYDDDLNPVFLVFAGVGSLAMSVVCTNNFYTYTETAPDTLPDSYIAIINQLSTVLAGYTYWVAPILVIYIAGNIILPKMINGLLKVQKVIERSERDV